MQNWIEKTVLDVYARLAGLYPAAFRDELAEEMQATFADLIQEAAPRGKLWLGLAVWRELRDLPGMLVREHWLALKARILGAPGRDDLGRVLERMAIWASDRKNVWRAFFLLLVLVSFAGPWVFDLINVPRQYECAPPNVRLEGDFCGIPGSGYLLFMLILVNFPLSVVHLITEPGAFSETLRTLLPALLFVLPLFPLGNTLLLLRGNHRRWREFNVLVWVLACFPTLYVVVGNTVSRTTPLLAPWGVWLFTGVAATALVFEWRLLRADRPDDRAAV